MSHISPATYLGIHVIEHSEKPPLAGARRYVTKKVSPLNFTVPKSVRELQGNLESEQERERVRSPWDQEYGKL